MVFYKRMNTPPFYTTFALLMKPFLLFLFTIVSVLQNKHAYAKGSSELLSSPKRYQLQKAEFNEAIKLDFQFGHKAYSGVKADVPAILTIEDQNEDEDIIKKHLSLARTFTAFAYAFLLNYPSYAISENLSFSQDISHASSCKYI